MNKQDLPYGVGVLVTKDGKFLCGIRSDNGQICGPGGHIETGETPEQAAVRETKEEFGIVPMDLIRIGCLKSPDASYLPTMVFLCSRFEGEPKTDGKEMVMPPSFEDIRTLDEKEALLYPAFDDSLNLLIDRIMDEK